MYDLVKPIDRKGTNCFKWDSVLESYGTEDIIPMSVADMDFKEPECVTKALHDYIDSSAFGYYQVNDSYFEAFIAWEEKYHGYKVEKDWIRFSPGVVPAINWFVDFWTKEGDAIMVTTPVYYPFMHAVDNHGRKLIMCDLVNTDGVYTIDFGKFERMIEEENVKMFILCSPHNPIGRVWTRGELTKISEICAVHGVTLLSDEIHGDFVYEGEHVATAMCAPDPTKVVTLTSASKTFNLAALQNSFIIIPDEEMRKAYDGFCVRINNRSGNAFGYVAYEAAYRGGRAWLDELKGIILENYRILKETLTAEDLKVTVSPLEGTYLAWVDLGAYVDKDTVEDFLVKECGVGLDYGSWFGGDRFAGFARFNLATPTELVKKAAENVAAAIRRLPR